MKKNGFVSTSLIYTFFIIFLLLMIFLLNSYSRVRFLLEEFKYDIKNSFADLSVADINLYIMVWDDKTNEYEMTSVIPSFGYTYEQNFSYCKNGSTISYVNGNISIAASGKDSCYVYFKESEKDIVLKLYTKESEDSQSVLAKNIPNTSYRLESATCTNGATIKFDEVSRKFDIESAYKTVCSATFIKIEMDIILNIYKEDANGSEEYNGIKYNLAKEVPGLGYTFDSYTCQNNSTIITPKEDSNELYVEADGKDVCNIYYRGGSEKVELIIMQETETGVSGYTTGKKYSRTYSIPSSGYAYVGYLCDDKDAKVTYQNGTLYGESSVQTTCRAYFNKYSDNILINYYLEKSYVYNREKSNCQNGSTLKVINNIVYVDASDVDICNVYFDIASSDIKVLVYVMNRETQKYELSSVPAFGYDLYNSGCTNGASIEYINSSLKVTSDGPTICTVYFR